MPCGSHPDQSKALYNNLRTVTSSFESAVGVLSGEPPASGSAIGSIFGKYSSLVKRVRFSNFLSEWMKCRRPRAVDLDTINLSVTMPNRENG